jgi:hypothetical protein
VPIAMPNSKPKQLTYEMLFYLLAPQAASFRLRKVVWLTLWWF